MDDRVRHILDAARSTGACAKTDGVSTLSDAVRLMFSPQGREFCIKHGYPTPNDLREIKGDLARHNVHVDAGDVECTNCDGVALIGSTYGRLSYSGTARLYHVIIMHGAEVEVTASRYAVVNIDIYGASVHVTDADGTAKVYINGKKYSNGR